MPKKKQTAYGQKLTAYHEAGHAIATLHLRRGVKEVLLTPDHEEFLGLCKWVPLRNEVHEYDFGHKPKVDRWAEDRIVVLLAGTAAEKRLTGRHGRVGASYDHHAAVEFACQLCGDPKEAEALIAFREETVRLIVSNESNWAAIEAVAAELLQAGRLSGKRVRQIFDQATAPPCGPLPKIVLSPERVESIRAEKSAGRLARALTHAKEADMAAALASVGEDVRARLRRALRAAARAT